MPTSGAAPRFLRRRPRQAVHDPFSHRQTRRAGRRRADRRDALGALTPEPRPEFVRLSVGMRVVRGRGARATRRAPATASGGRRPTGPTPSRCSKSRPKPGARARAHPLRAHAGQSVHVLPGRRAGHGGRSGAHAELGHHRAALRRRPRVELRRVRLARAPVDLRYQRLRRDPARGRGSGTSNVWRPVWRSPAATSALPLSTAATSSSRRSASTATSCASRRRCRPSTSGTRR